MVSTGLKFTIRMEDKPGNFSEQGKSQKHDNSIQTVPAEPPPDYSTITTPFGLEQLAELSRVDVHHHGVKTEHGEAIFTLRRELNASGLLYDLWFDLYDKTERKVISFHPIQSCFSARLEVFVSDELVSLLNFKFAFTLSPTYYICDAQNRKTLKIRAPKFGQTTFLLRLKDMQDKKLGVITKKWNGVGAELFADSYVFEISFPKDLAVRYKAAIIGFCVFTAQTDNMRRMHESD